MFPKHYVHNQRTQLSRFGILSGKRAVVSAANKPRPHTGTIIIKAMDIENLNIRDCDEAYLMEHADDKHKGEAGNFIFIKTKTNADIIV